MVARRLLAAAMTGAAFAPAVTHASWLVCLLALPHVSSMSIRKHTALFRQNGVAYHTPADLRGAKVGYKQNGDEVENPYAYAKAVQQRGNSPIKIYHYTTDPTAFRIFKTRRLKASTKDENPSDARHGDGQYFTSMPPWANEDRLMHNNYDGAARWTKKRGKTLEAYVEIDVRSFLATYGYYASYNVL